MRAEFVFHLNRHLCYLLQLVCHKLHGSHALQRQLIVVLFYRQHLIPRAAISLWASHAPLAERALAVLAWWYTVAMTTLKITIHIAQHMRRFPLSFGHVSSGWTRGKIRDTGFLLSCYLTNGNWWPTLSEWRLRALVKLSFSMEFICIKVSLCESLWCNLPLSHLFICIPILFGWIRLHVFDLLLEPIYIIGLLHYNLDTGTSHVQLVINCVEELGLSINTHFFAALPREWSAKLMLESILAAYATTSSQGLLKAFVSFNKLVILLILLPFLLFLLSLFCLFLFLALFENLINNFAAFEQMLHVFFGFLAEIFCFAWRWWVALRQCITTYRRHLALIIDLIDRALV